MFWPLLPTVRAKAIGLLPESVDRPMETLLSPLKPPRLKAVPTAGSNKIWQPWVAFKVAFNMAAELASTSVILATVALPVNVLLPERTWVALKLPLSTRFSGCCRW